MQRLKVAIEVGSCIPDQPKSLGKQLSLSNYDEERLYK